MSSLSVSSSTTNPYQPSSQSQGTVQSEFQALGQALQSGNLAAAQQAFSQIQQAGGHHHHHHHGSQNSSSSTAATTASPTSAGTGANTATGTSGTDLTA